MTIITPPSLEFELAKIAAERGLRVSPGTLDANWFNQGKLLGQKVKGANLGKEFADEVAKRAAKEAAKEVPKQAGFLEGIANFVGEWLLKRPAQWIENLLRKVPGLGALLDFGKKHIGTAGKFFANIGGFIAELPVIKTVLKFFGAADRFLGKLANWGLDKLGRFLSHPAVSKFLGILGLVADAFSIFSTISQWNELNKFVSNQDRFSDQIRRLMDVEAARTRASITTIKNDLKRESAINQGQNNQIVKINGLINTLNSNYAKVASDVRAQQASVNGLRDSLRNAVTATAVSTIAGAAISKAIAQYQLGRVPGLVSDVAGLKARPAKIDPADLAPFNNRLRTVESAIPDIRNAIRTAGVGKPGPKGDKGDRGAPGLNGITTTIVRREEVPIRVVETKVVQVVDPTLKAEVMQAKLAAQSAASSANTAAVNATSANAKLGDALPGGGVSGYLVRMQAFTEKAWRFGRLDKVLTALTYITTLHNAMMLSRSVGATLGELTGLALQVIGIKDETGAAIDVNQILGGLTSNFVKSIVGEQVYSDTVKKWAAFNRIVQSTSQIIWTVRSMADSAGEIAEWIAENTGKIGNALKRFGVVGERAYPWMPERVNRQDAYSRKINRMREGLESIDDAASSLTGALGEVRSIQEELGELQEQKQAFNQALQEADKLVRPNNTPVRQAEDAAKAASQSPDLTGTSRSNGG